MTKICGFHGERLVMDFYFSVPGEVRVTMVDYLKKGIADFPEEIMKTPPTPTGDDMFEVFPDKERKMLDNEQATALHNGVMQLLFDNPRRRKDIQKPIVFLTTRVKELDEYDWRELRQFPQYLHGIIYIPLILSNDSLNVIMWWVYSLYVVHGDMRVHTGATMSLGSESEISMSKKTNQHVEL